MTNESSHPDDDKQTSGVTIGDVIGGIHNSIIAGRDVIINTFTGGTGQQRAQRNRQAMLRLVKDFWIKGVLEKSLHGAAMIELGLEERADAVERPWDMLLQTPEKQDRQLPPGTRIVDVFDEMNRSLLILGEPGSGKTTMLLELARDTIARAEEDPTEPIPVVFNLSSWAEKRRPLAEWLVEELNIKYHIPKRIARTWVANDDLLLLLDGLDEVKVEHRDACVEAINEFRQEHGLTPIVVCSRVADYEALTTRLKLQGAVLLQPLSPEQVDTYLARAGTEMAAMRALVREDEAMQELASSPLTLSVMTLAYRGRPLSELQSFASVEEHRTGLFDAYTDRMFKRIVRTKRAPFSKEETRRRLTWLARKMHGHAQSEFLIEQLQPSWLSSRFQTRCYTFTTRLVGATMVSLSFSFGVLPLVWSLLTVDLPRFPEGGLSRQVPYVLAVLMTLAMLVVPPLVSGVISGVVFGFRDTISFGRSHRAAWLERMHPGFLASAIATVVLVTLIVGLSSGQIVARIYEWPVFMVESSSPADESWLPLSLLGGFLGLVISLVFTLRGRNRDVQTDIQTVEVLSWSWGRFTARFLIIGVIPVILILGYYSISFSA